jgi:multiple sugar transport system substrate-binding protein
MDGAEGTARRSDTATRRWYLAAVAALSAPAWGGCGVATTRTPAQPGQTTGAGQWAHSKETGDAGGAFTIVTWEGPGKIEKWQQHIDSFFTTFYPKVKVEMETVGGVGDALTKLVTVVASGVPLDYIWMHDTRCATAASKGLVAPLDDFLKRLPAPGWPDKFFKTQVDAFRYQGKQYALPYDWAPGGFYANLDLLDAKGIKLPAETWTFADLLDAARQLTKNTGEAATSTWGVDLPVSSSGSYWIVRNFGGETVAGEPPRSQFGHPKTLEAYQYLADLRWKHNVMATPDQLTGVGGTSRNAFANGKIAFWYALNDQALQLVNLIKGAFRLGFVATPKGPDKRYQFVGGSGFSIPKTSGRQEMSYELMRWIVANPDNLPKTATMAQGGTFVSRADFWEYGLPPKELNLDGDRFKRVFYDLGQRDGVYPTYFVGFADWDPQVYGENMNPLWNGQQQDVRQALDRVQQETARRLQAGP